MGSCSASWLTVWCRCPSTPIVPGKGAIPFPQSAALLPGKAGPSVRGWDAFPAGGKHCPSALCAVTRTPASAPAGLCRRPRCVPAVTGLPPHSWPVARAQGTPASRLRDRWLCSLGNEIGIALLAFWRDCPSSTRRGVPRGLAERWLNPHTSWRRRGASLGPLRPFPAAQAPLGRGPASGPVRATPEPGREPPGRGGAGGTGAPCGGSGAGAFARGTRRGGSKAERGAARLLPWAPG